MPVEVEDSGYMYYPDSDRDFSHNPLHDLESLWWVGVWFLLCHYYDARCPNLPHKPYSFSMLEMQDMKMQEHMKVIQEFGQTLFNSGADHLSRRHALIRSTLLTNSHPAGFPKTVQYLVFVLDKFRAQLNMYYKNYNPKKPQDRSYFTPDVHHQCSVLFENALQSSTLWNDDTELIPFHMHYLYID